MLHEPRLLHASRRLVSVSGGDRLSARLPYTIRSENEQRRRRRLLPLLLGHEHLGVPHTRPQQEGRVPETEVRDTGHRDAGVELQQQRGDPEGGEQPAEEHVPEGALQTVRILKVDVIYVDRKVFCIEMRPLIYTDHFTQAKSCVPGLLCNGEI